MELKGCPMCGADVEVSLEDEGSTMHSPCLDLYCSKCGTDYSVVDRIDWNNRPAAKEAAWEAWKASSHHEAMSETEDRNWFEQWWKAKNGK